MNRQKWMYLPEAHSNVENPEHAAAPVPEPRGAYLCPCCGCRTLPVAADAALAYICPVCFWENDVFLTADDEPSDENHGLTLQEARENYRQYGAVLPRLVPYTRKPTPEELPR